VRAAARVRENLERDRHNKRARDGLWLRERGGAWGACVLVFEREQEKEKEKAMKIEREIWRETSSKDQEEERWKDKEREIGREGGREQASE